MGCSLHGSVYKKPKSKTKIVVSKWIDILLCKHHQLVPMSLLLTASHQCSSRLFNVIRVQQTNKKHYAHTNQQTDLGQFTILDMRWVLTGPT